jgi:hypothetical protein
VQKLLNKKDSEPQQLDQEKALSGEVAVKKEEKDPMQIKDQLA